MNRLNALLEMARDYSLLIACQKNGSSILMPMPGLIYLTAFYRLVFFFYFFSYSSLHLALFSVFYCELFSFPHKKREYLFTSWTQSADHAQKQQQQQINVHVEFYLNSFVNVQYTTHTVRVSSKQCLKIEEESFRATFIHIFYVNAFTMPGNLENKRPELRFCFYCFVFFFNVFRFSSLFFSCLVFVCVYFSLWLWTR